jgi:hypothetical protein
MLIQLLEVPDSSQRVKIAPGFVSRALIMKLPTDVCWQNEAMFTDPKGTLNAGYHIKSADTFNFWAQLVNYNKEPAKVYVTFDTEWVPGLLG